MSHTLLVSDEARAEIDEAVGWYERQSPGVGFRLQKAVGTILKKIQETPNRFAPFSPAIRKAGVPRFPYFIYYAQAGEIIGVIAVFHAKRSPEALQARLRRNPFHS